jgi:serine/threonine protein kinase
MAVDAARAKTLFLNASDLTDPAERAAYLDRECGDDAELRARVEALLRANDESPLPPPTAGDPEATGEHTPDAESSSRTTAEYLTKLEPGIVIASRYTLQEPIGEGGMGIVWVAKQTEPVKRKVALKLIKMGMDSRAVIARFEQERQALAMMDHPNIAKVLDGGLTPTGQPFFVMELVNGLPLTKFCDEIRLTPRERLELFVPICQAVQHAHQKGIVHRDLKPANILITMIDGKPVPKVIDFGVAKATAGKLTDESMSTQFGAVVGTLEYMSPEQAGFSGTDIDTRADIYSLGVILYELLTGLRPIDAKRLKKAALTEMLRIIQEEEPSKPSTRLSTDESLAALRHTEPRKLMALLRGELDWVVMKCLEKHRERRYETANALARDIQRYLADEAVEARPPSASYRLSKFLKRNRGPVLAASFVFLALLAGFLGTAWGLYRADRALRAEARQTKIAVEEKKKAEESEAIAREQKKKAEESEAIAKQQRARAEAGEEQAIDAVKKFRDAVANNPELKNNPALESLRKTLLKEPLAFIKALRDRLMADHDTRPESLSRLASASFGLGQLTNEIGDKQDALIAVRESLAIFQKLADANPTVTQFQNELGRSHYNTGILLSDTGRPAEALQAYESALLIHKKLVEANPTVTEFQSDLAASHNNLGILLSATGQPAEALKAYEAALLIHKKLVEANPTVTQFQSALATSHYNIGNLLSATGRPAEALQAYESALLIRKKLIEANPTVTEFQNALARSHGNIGNLLSATGRPAEALQAYEAALLIQKKLVEANPTVTEFQSDLAASHNNIGLLLSATGRPAEALQAYESALLIQKKLAREHPESPDFAHVLGASLNNLAVIDLDAKRFDEALTRLREAVEWQRKALAANPANPSYRQFLANHWTNLIEAYRGLDDAQGVAEAERELAKLRESDPTILALDGRLTSILKGQEQPKDNAERLQLAQRAYDKGLHASSAKLWGEAIDADPKVAEDRQAQHRYNAACSAALAGCGQGKDDPAPDEAAKTKLRELARVWLRAELEAWAKIVESGTPKAKALVVHTLDHWKEDTDLAGIRDPALLEKLPESEREGFRALWTEVEALRQKASEK